MGREFLMKQVVGKKAGWPRLFYATPRLSRRLQRCRRNFNCRNQAATFLRVRFVGTGASGSLGAFGLRPSPIVFASDERFAA